MVYPKSITHRIRYYLWLALGPYHKHVRNGAIKLKVIKNYGRQPFLLGIIAPHVSIEDLVTRLVSHGYAYHRVAWEDDGEIVSLRHVKDFIFQYHVRVFEDREVRAHYEYTPECYPLAHLMNTGFEAKTDEFLAIIGDMLVPAQADTSDFRWEILPFVQKIWK